MTDFKEMVMAQRRAEAGVTPLGIKILKVNALPDYDVDEQGRVVDPDTGAIVTDKEVLAPIMETTRKQMETTSQTGEKLLGMKI
jgi:hypothetical protein